MNSEPSNLWNPRVFPLSPQTDRFLSESECTKLAKRLAALKQPGEEIWVNIGTTWTGYVRWARNEVLAAGDVRENQVGLFRQKNRT